MTPALLIGASILGYYGGYIGYYSGAGIFLSIGCTSFAGAGLGTPIISGLSTCGAATRG